MTQQIAPTTCNTASACGAFNLDGVNMADKAMSEIMDAATAGQKWADAILQADRQGIKNHYQLNPQNTRGNLYGALRFGIKATPSFNSSDATVRNKLTEWVNNLNKMFPGVPSYTPESLAQRVSDLKHAASCIGANTKTLAAAGELSANDANQLTGLVAGLESYANAGAKLLEAVKAGPCIKTVSLNIQPQKH
jgi:hypothetical protein